MAQWIAVDDAPEATLPEWGRGGARNRVVLAEQGIAHVEKGRGSVAAWPDVLGVAVVDDAAYLLVPRRPPRAPWLRVAVDMLPSELRAAGISGLVAAVEGRRASAGYRGAAAVRSKMTVAELEGRVRAREPIPGAVEVPPRLLLAPWSPAKGLTAVAAAFIGMIAIPIAGLVALRLTGERLNEDAFACAFYGFFFVGAASSIALLKLSWRWIDKRYYACTPAPRMLVLAPDGCMVALEGGARAFAWSEIGGFRSEGDPDEQSKDGRTRLVVESPRGRPHGVIDGAWFGAPLPLIAAVAEAYRLRVG